MELGFVTKYYQSIEADSGLGFVKLIEYNVVDG